ncbi:LLM class flavin-dependent oxidoreductase [Cellulomonas fimi]|uniref:Luciferase-like, subgroup n=1 Tax=Cellulomonas fimi (strain ATCC 484 / DSM 20113 / JCM 1341 / CCUG 24087 / LMG 16345 / NBRC 15513 / NCIMB 8980 / NCTC 7547 / NRS-133) TaxID=590998 RepID=F4H5L3_CELFA|nr:LLM class flavin-dependent oxidoreductase [Cellulomonas fimi]AEE44337.1 Luciferase-like, subgroup [Cellulomonas fimi ATCC 484]NNH08138.1 LLM class flavin-dependent oxidoreductase [Cellulomonas fimi]VEH26152.1 Phthiodiolone/phenolphthiodiolone dimycocerosates ketoreductase [Cellulomonas fimi]
MTDRAVGVLLPRDLPVERVREFARRAEELGFDELWVVEDCFFRGGIAQAAAVLAWTERIRVGIGILPAAVRDAAFTAMEAATLAELFPGRVDVGIGHGMPAWMRQVGAWPSSPLTLLEEHLRAVRAIVHGERVDVDGRYVQLDGVQLEYPPAHPPRILAGVRGPKSLAASGRAADGTVLAEPVTPEYVAEALRHIAPTREHRVVAYCVAAVDDDADSARRLARPALAWVGEPDWAPHIAPLPYAQEFAELRAGVGSPDEFAQVLPDAWVDDLAVVGTPDAARARMEALWSAGVTVTVLFPLGPDPVRALDALARVL